MQMLVGLGNPGARHAANRHNIGFMALERIAQEHGFGAWRSKFRGEAADGRIGGEKVVLLRPHTFMNESGVAVSEAMRLLQARACAGDGAARRSRTRPRKDSGSRPAAGMPGTTGCARSTSISAPNTSGSGWGIGRPADKRAVTGHVLGDFAAVDQEWLEALLRGVSEGRAAARRGASGTGFSAPRRATSSLQAPRRPRPAKRRRNPPKPRTRLPRLRRRPPKRRHRQTRRRRARMAARRCAGFSARSSEGPLRAPRTPSGGRHSPPTSRCGS